MVTKKRKYGKMITQKTKYFKSCLKGRDNKDYYNSNGWLYGNKWSIRVPSLKESKKTWMNFYKLFPYIKKRLTDPESYNQENPNRLFLEGDVIVEKLVRYRTVNDKSVMVVKTRKYKKIW